MKEVSRFIPMEGNDENVGKNAVSGIDNVGNSGAETGNSTFRVCSSNGSNLPAKPSLWTKLKGILTYEIKVELTPYQQKVEDEINEFLHQEITWSKVHDFLFQDISFGKKKTTV